MNLDKLPRLAALPSQAWLHIFVSHLVAVAYGIHLGSEVAGAPLAFWSVTVLGWAAAISGGVVLAYFILLWLTARSLLRTGMVSPPFFLIHPPNENE